MKMMKMIAEMSLVLEGMLFFADYHAYRIPFQYKMFHEQDSAFSTSGNFFCDFPILQKFWTINIYDYKKFGTFLKI